MSWQRPPIGAFLLWFRERAARKSTAPSGRSLLQSLHSRPSIRREVALLLASGGRAESLFAAQRHPTGRSLMPRTVIHNQGTLLTVAVWDHTAD